MTGREASKLRDSLALGLSAPAGGRARPSEAAEVHGRALVRAILDSALDAIIVIDESGRILEFGHSAERMLGFAAAEATGRRIDELIIPEPYRERHRQGLARAVAGDDAPFVGRRLELSALRADGSEFPAEVTVARLDLDGRPRFVGFIRDITRRKRYERTMRDRERQLRSLAAKLSLAEERERRRIATGLHDLVGHPLALAKLRLGELCRSPLPREALRAAKDTLELVTQAIEESRSLSFELGSPVLYELGLEAALRSLGKRIARQSGLRFHFSTDDRPKPLAEDSQVILYRVVEELLVNTVKHAGARNARVRVERDGNDVRIIAEDDGVGLGSELGEVLSTNVGLGLVGARERLDRIGGRLIIDGDGGSGTRIVVTAPLMEDPLPKDSR